MAVIPFSQVELEDGSLQVTWADPASPEDTYEPFPFGPDYVVFKTERCVPFASAAKGKKS